MIPEKILLVDDDMNIVKGLRRQFRHNFNIEGANSGEEALETIRVNGPFAVVVSDMRMPGIDGVELLSQIQQLSPQTVRIMLTGDADHSTATRAVNESNIFRLVRKPCPPEQLAKALGDAIEQYRLITAERDLLENTLSGSVKLLSEVLSLLNPETFGQFSDLRYPIRELCTVLGIRHSWDIEVAAMLADIGRVTLPTSILERSKSGLTLSQIERELLARLPERTAKLLENIPRLSAVAAIVLHHQKNFDGSGFPESLIAGEEIPIGARLIRILRDMITAQKPGEGRSETLRRLSITPGFYDPQLIELVISYYEDIEGREKKQAAPRAITVGNLLTGQVVAQPIETRGGIRIVNTGVLLNEMLIERVKNFAKYAGVKEPIFVTEE